MADEFTNFYESFYSTFLTTANGLPINSMWIVMISDIPTTVIGNYIEPYEGWYNLQESHDKSKAIAKSSKGLVLAQGVKVVGDSMDVTRVGTKNTGYIQGLISNGRTAFPLLNIGIIENNSSFVDYVLRPWQIAVSHGSLKDFSLRKNIDVLFFTKVGPRIPISRRKVVKYYNCCPVSINEQEYNYSGSDMMKIRDIQFAYSHYSIEPMGRGLRGLLNDSGSTGFFSDLTNQLKNELQRQFGANSPEQYIDNLVGKAKSFGKDLITGTATSIVKNTAGALQGVVDNAITKVESKARGVASDFVGSVNDLTNGLLGNESKKIASKAGKPTNGMDASLATAIDTNRRIGANKAAFGGYVEKNIKTDDSPAHLQTIEEIQRSKPTVVDVNKILNQNDTPSSKDINVIPANVGSAQDANADTVTINTPLRYFVRKSDPPMNDVRAGQINHENVMKKIGQNDYVRTLTMNEQSNKQINQNDIVNSKDISFLVKSIKQNDVTNYKKST